MKFFKLIPAVALVFTACGGGEPEATADAPATEPAAAVAHIFIFKPKIWS